MQVSSKPVCLSLCLSVCFRLHIKVEFQQPEKNPLLIFLDAHESDTIDELKTMVSKTISDPWGGCGGWGTMSIWFTVVAWLEFRVQWQI